MAWVEKDLKDHWVSTPLLCAELPTTRPGCPNPYPAWSWMPSGMGHPQPPWATCSNKHKCVTCEFSNGMYRIAIKNLVTSLYQTFVRPLLPERSIPPFTIMPYSCHCFVAVHAFVNSCFEGWRTGEVKFHQKSLLNTLRAHWELQPLPSNQTNALVSQNQGKRPHMFYCLLLSLFIMF